MDNTGVLVIVAILALLALGIAAFARRRRSDALRHRFGPEYDHAVERTGDRARAEAELAAREKRVAKLELRELPEPERVRFAESWRDVQARFVDNPGMAVRDADRLVKELMQAKGYPMGDFEQRAADISVDHPQVVTNYRAARAIAHANEQGQASTDHLREAMVHYRALFEELLGTQAVPGAPGRAEAYREMEPVGAGAPLGAGTPTGAGNPPRQTPPPRRR
jgi:hypothetical protein